VSEEGGEDRVARQRTRDDLKEFARLVADDASAVRFADEEDGVRVEVPVPFEQSQQPSTLLLALQNSLQGLAERPHHDDGPLPRRDDGIIATPDDLTWCSYFSFPAEVEFRERASEVGRGDPELRGGARGMREEGEEAAVGGGSDGEEGASSYSLS
jgi:hypothetical protein